MSPGTQELVIGPTDTWWIPPVAEAWKARGLFSFFIWKDVRVRYKQTFIGFLWVMLQPMLEMLVFTVVFGHFFDKVIAGAPYALFAYAGLLPWTYMSVTVQSGTQTLVAHADIVKRIYFPRFLLPIANALAKMIDLGISLVLLLFLLLATGTPITERILLLPLVCLLLLIAAAGVSLWLSILHALYRDVGLIVPYFLRLSLFLTPVVYPLSSLSPTLQTALWLNPLTSAVELFRTALLPGLPLPWNGLLLGSGLSLLIFVTGFLFFRRMEGRVLDII